ncbi:hypothetical protein C1H46_035220 [Malus baccata]|uniref:DYW domain-containing protein n=1 Tax=Malus baccata TaxID=106549 RepID=A0A540KYU6_MALBA|nr:hypothetical protein C1H46_035220 [Malus baccata]
MTALPVATKAQTSYQKLLQTSSSTRLLSLIKSCTTKSHLLQIHAHTLRTSLVLDPTISFQFLSLVVALSPLKSITYSRQFFDQIEKPTAFHYNKMIRACSKSDSPAEGFYLYRDLRRRGLCADAMASSFVIKSCIRVSSLVGGIQVHARILRDGHRSDSLLLTTLMDLYSNCRKYDEACQVFDEMPKRDTVAWNVLISCCLHNNRTRDALGLFDIMQSEIHRCEPDDVTCLLVLQACASLNALEFGERVHKYIEDHGYGERVVGHLIELKAQEAGDYVLLMNIYSSAGNWEKLTEVRKFMKEKAIQTTPGCSTIELKGVAHEFVVDDVSHLRKDEIYKMLDEINSQLKIAGYVADVTSELHNLGAEDKGHALSHHSEKLAIAFGVLSTPPGTPIRVAKNLRICVDCHNFAMALSGVYNREVIIRDRTRFHHFREGHCSCNGYW